MIDILMATYNGEKYVDKQLSSIFEQKFSQDDFTVIIRDDGSSDDTINIIQDTISLSGVKDKTLIINDGEASGSAKKNFMRLVKYEKNNRNADYIMFSDQDDIWEAEKIEKTYNRMRELEKRVGKESPVLVHTDLYVADENAEIVGNSLISYMNLPREDVLKNLLMQNSVTGCTMMINRSALNLMAKADEDGDYVIHDHFASVLIATFGYVNCIMEPTVRYRQHLGNVIGASDANSFSYKFKRMLKGRKNFRSEMDNCYKQAGYILDTYKDEIKVLEEKRPDKVDLIREYAALIDKRSSEKRRFFKKNAMYKTGRIKKIMQIIWC